VVALFLLLTAPIAAHAIANAAYRREQGVPESAAADAASEEEGEPRA
jgi:multisubunit Na+/H+ antiporter MnhG subunit